jgi:phage gpG-like protein
MPTPSLFPKELQKLWTLACKDDGRGGELAFEHRRYNRTSSILFASKRLRVSFDADCDKNATENSSR